MAAFILANPRRNISNWGGKRLRNGMHWQRGVRPKSAAGFALANGSMSSERSCTWGRGSMFNDR